MNNVSALPEVEVLQEFHFFCVESAQFAVSNPLQKWRGLAMVRNHQFRMRLKKMCSIIDKVNSLFKAHQVHLKIS